MIPGKVSHGGAGEIDALLELLAKGITLEAETTGTDSAREHETAG